MEYSALSSSVYKRFSFCQVAVCRKEKGEKAKCVLGGFVVRWIEVSEGFSTVARLWVA